MTNFERYHKLIAIELVSKKIEFHRLHLAKELQSQAQNTTIFQRRFRMLGQLAQYEAQIYKKLYEFQTTDPNDYFFSVSQVIREIEYVTDRSS